MQRLGVIAAVGLLALACSARPAAGSGDDLFTDGLATPLFAWSSQPVFGGEVEGLSHRTAYEVVTDLRGTIRDLVAGVVSGEHASCPFLSSERAAAGQPDVVLTVLGSQLTGSDVKRQEDALRPLQDMMASAASSLALPNVIHQVDVLGSQLQGALSEAMAAAASAGQAAGRFHALGCSYGADLGMDAASAAQLIAEGGAGAPLVMLVCSGRTGGAAAAAEAGAGAAASPAPAADGAASPLAGELGALQRLQDAVAAAGKSYVTLYAQQPSEEAVRYVQQRRRLMAQASAANKQYTTCDELCQTQVRFLQGILAALLIGFASICGYTCLNLLDTPTRFQKPTDSRSD